MRVEVVSPEAVTYSGEADLVVVRTVDGGDLAFQPGHVPFIGLLQVWEARVVRPDRSDTFAVHRGFVQCAADTVSILSDVAERADEIDVARAREALARAEEALAGDPHDADAAAARDRAELRLRVAGAEPVGAGH